MRRLILCLLLLSAYCLSALAQGGLPEVGGNRFVPGASGSPYSYVGMTMWYAPILAGKGEWADTALLHAQLDTLKAYGVRNLRVLAGAQLRKEKDDAGNVRETLVCRTGKDRTLAALDALLLSLRSRGMKATVCLTDTLPTDSVSFSSFRQFIERLLTHTDRHTGRTYSLDTTILAWEICLNSQTVNAETLPMFSRYASAATALVRQYDKGHPIALGSVDEEKLHGGWNSLRRLMSDRNADYITLTLFPAERKWVSPGDYIGGQAHVLIKTEELLEKYERLAIQLNKPFVVSAANYPRDASFTHAGTPTSARGVFLGNLLLALKDSHARGGAFAGLFMDGWGGNPLSENTGAGKKTQPLFSAYPRLTRGAHPIFATDGETLCEIRKYLKP